MTIGRGLVLAVVLGGAILAAVLLRAGGHVNPTVARVGGEPVTQKQLDAVVQHFRLEAKAEGKPFPDEDSEAFRRLRNQLVTRVEVVKRLQRSGERERPIGTASSTAPSRPSSSWSGSPRRLPAESVRRPWPSGRRAGTGR